MKQYTILLFGLLIFTGSFGQEHACRQDTLLFSITNYRGQLVWQQSTDGSDWSAVQGANSDTLKIIAVDPSWYRAEVIEGSCEPLYSGAIQLIVHDIPAVTLEFRDSICINESSFMLSGGFPVGGAYAGPGVVDGKYNPREAGPGQFTIRYRFWNPQTYCANTAYDVVNILPIPDVADAGEDIKAVTADSVRLNANIPANGTGFWTLVNGEYGRFSDIYDPKAWFIRDSSHLDFTLRWTISNKCATYTDEVTVGFLQLSKNPCPGTPTLTDADGHVYPTVQIGNQCWMARSLNTGKMVVSTVTQFPHSDLSNNGIVEKYCYDNNPYNCELYGGLYDWDEGMNYTDSVGGRGICPPGWHIPSDDDWRELNRFYKYNDAGAHLKVGGDSGFDAYFSGDRHALGEFFSFGSTGFFMESGTYNYQGANDGYVREVCACNSFLPREYFTKRTGVSIRCIKDR